VSRKGQRRRASSERIRTSLGGEPARAQGFSLDRDYGIWFKSFDPAKDFDCKPDASMSSCKPKERPSGKRYYHGVQLRGPQVVPLLDPWVGN